MITPAYAITATERVLPRMALDFTTGVLDPRVTFTRASTATFVGSNGLIQTAAINGPRFDYNPATLAPRGLLIEEQRANIALYSDQFDSVSWVKGGASVTANSTTSPDGTANADTLTEDTSTGDHRTFQLVFVSVAAAYAFSVYVKPNGRSLITLTFAGVGEATYNIATGAVTNTVSGAAEIQAAGNGWYRCIIRFTATSTAYNGQIRLVNTGTNTSYTGDGTSGVFLYGAQLEAGAFATSYIPTVASQATRNPDVVTMTGTNFSSWYNAGEGSFAVVADTAKPTSLVAIAEITSATDGTANNRAITRFITASVESLVISAGVVGTQLSAAYTVNTASKLVSALKQNSFATAINGATAILSGSGNMPVGADRLNIGGLGNLNGHVASIRYWPQRVTNSEVQAFSK